MKNLLRHDAVTGLVLLSIGIAVIIEMRTSGAGDWTIGGPTGLPLILAGGLLVGGGIMLVFGLRQVIAGKAAARDHDEESLDWARIAVIIAGLAGYALVLPTLGFIAASMVFLCISLLVHGAPRRSLLTTPLTALATYAVFAWLLRVPLPAADMRLPW